VIGWFYDLLTSRSEKGELAERRHDLVAGLEGDVLEVGAGTGLNLRHYERAARVVALEPDASMAKRLPARAAAAAVRVEIVPGSADSIPFPEEAFDAVVATFVLCSVESPAAALAEMRRVLKPSGRLVLLEHVRGEGKLGRWQDRITPVHCRLAGNCHLNRDTRAAVAAAGFDATEMRPTQLPGTHKLVRTGLHGTAIKTSS
jgi:ubiquinone/menaquinone biosynthesis C-methylase UbiE